jgi:hypothetical protein
MYVDRRRGNNLPGFLGGSRSFLSGALFKGILGLY